MKFPRGGSGGPGEEILQVAAHLLMEPSLAVFLPANLDPSVLLLLPTSPPPTPNQQPAH